MTRSEQDAGTEPVDRPLDTGGLTRAQLPIAIGQQLHAESPLYNMAFAFVIEDELEPERFRAAWRQVTASSEALQTRFRSGPGGRLQRFSSSELALTVADFSGQEDAVARFLDWGRARCARPLPLDGPLVDSVLVRLPNRQTGWYLNQHHLITDAWSTRLLYDRLAASYLALESQPEFAPRPVTADRYYALAPGPRASDRSSTTPDRTTAPGGLTLYGERPSPVHRGTASVRSSLQLDAERSSALRARAAEAPFASVLPHLSLFALFSTLFHAFLSQISAEPETSFDTPLLGRSTPEAKDTIGLFIEMFPFAARVPEGTTFRRLGAETLARAMDLLRSDAAGTAPTPEHSMSRAVLNYLPVRFGRFGDAATAVTWLHPGHADHLHALRLQIHDFSGSGRFQFDFDLNRTHLSAAARERIPHHFETLVEALLRDPDQRIDSIDLRTDDERQQLDSFNQSDRCPTPERTVVDAFFDTANRHPTRVALELVVDGTVDQSVDYAQVRDQVAILANHLLRVHHLQPGDRVAVLGDRSLESVVAILAVLSARGAYVPIDPAHPEERQKQLVEDSGATLLLDPPTVRQALDHGHDSRPPEPPSLTDLAYLLYTSGSTGRAKGVLIEHRGLADYLEFAERTYVRGEALRYGLVTSLAFDLTVTSLFLPLITGGTLELYPRAAGALDEAFLHAVERNQIDFLKLTPSHLSVLRSGRFEATGVRRLIVGGESFSAELAAAVAERLAPSAEIYNEYGPTEAVVGCLVHRFDPASDRVGSVPIGRPADHVQIEVLNPAGQAVPTGVPGELWIARHGLARGYHQLPEETAARFVPGPEPGAAVRYRSGDLVRFVDPTKLEYLGRTDRQVKVAGFRLEPGEVETLIETFPGVERCAVLVVGTPGPADADLGVPTPNPGAGCRRCGLPANYPGATFDAEGTCSLCHSYESIREHAAGYFRTLDDLRSNLDEARAQRRGPWDCLMLYSGGKDSTYALCRLADLGYSIYAFTLDNGFISEGAKENIRRVTDQLGVDVEFATTPAMNEIFRDSLQRFSNVCNGCFKTIYTLATRRAHELGIPAIVTGLSRGQMFETRLTEEMFRHGRVSPEEVDQAVLASRKAYHRTPDAVSRTLDVSLFATDEIFERVRFVDFYRYCDVDMEELYSYLKQRVPWVRPEDTGRSTNCLINDAGIFVHQRERGFHNYALPYSWDVRLGHKKRDEALEELDDAIDEERVRSILQEVGYAPQSGPAPESLQAFLVPTADASVDTSALARHLGRRLPAPLVPAQFHQLSDLPLTPNGKLDLEALRRWSLPTARHTRPPVEPPRGPVEEFLAGLWRDELALDEVGRGDDFFELGGTSLTAMRMILRLCDEFDLDLPLETVFAQPSLAGLARIAEDALLAELDSELD